MDTGLRALYHRSGKTNTGHALETAVLHELPATVHVQSLIAEGKLRAKEVTEGGRRKRKLYPC